MKLVSLNYKQHEGKPEEWRLNFSPVHPKINLIVGKNASGKTRTINVISNLALLLSGARKQLFSSANWEAIFENIQKQEVKYILCIKDGSVQEEIFILDKRELLRRGVSGEGKILASELDKEISFKVAPDEIAAVKKRDSLQHPFLEDLYGWADSLKIYRFGTGLGQKSLGGFMKPSLGTETDISQLSAQQYDLIVKEPTRVVTLFREGCKKFGNQFQEAIKSDMESIGYKLKSITVEPVTDIQFFVQNIPLSEPPSCIYVKEQELKAKVQQIEISQGMFRALSLIIHLNFLEFTQVPPSCILIDDIGEGLDYERSTSLIKLLINKITANDTKSKPVSLQLIMTSNDRFIMNGVPLEYWSVIDRIPGEAKIYNIHNSEEIFKEFEFTGLNKFDFFASGFYKGQP